MRYVDATRLVLWCACWLGSMPLAVTMADARDVDPLDWTYCRGPDYRGVSPETGLIDDFDPDGGPGSNVLWKRTDLGGRSTPVTMNGRLYTLLRAEPGTKREGERIVCLDAATGETLWEKRFNVWLSDVPDTRVGWSSVVADPETGYVYAHGVCGFFQCLDGSTGERIWSVPLHERFGLLSTYGGRTNFPVICEDLVITSGIVINWGDAAKPAHRFIAFDKRTGDVVWFRGTRPFPYDTSYSAPTVSVLAGKKALVLGSGDGQVWAIQARTGVPIWNYDFSRRGLNAPPLVVDDVVYTGHSQENTTATTAMGCVVAIDGTREGDITADGAIWRVEELLMGRSAPVLVDERLYWMDDGAKLYVLDAKSGKPLARKVPLSTVMYGSPLYADGKLYVFTASGRWYILAPDERRGAKTLKRGQMPRGEECLASPICSHGRIYVQTTGALYCLADPAKEPSSLPRPPAAEEPPVDSDRTPAHVQIVPAEMLLRPGQTQDLKVRLFNRRGQLLGTAQAAFQLEGPGQVSQEGRFQAASTGEHTATIITARVGDLVGTARARTVPDLPWHFDFEGLSDPPVTWVGARYRHVIRQVDGDAALVKVTTIPKGTRSRSWFGHSDLSNYTIEAEVKGAIQDGKMPDIGLIAQGYTIDLLGASQQLQVRSWVTQLRMAETVEFPWKPDRWYHLKLQVSVEDGQGYVRGKAWPVGEQEPSQWTVEAIDPVPNLSGSPGLYGNAKDAEIYLDNIRVYPNS